MKCSLEMKSRQAKWDGLRINDTDTNRNTNTYIKRSPPQKQNKSTFWINKYKAV